MPNTRMVDFFVVLDSNIDARYPYLVSEKAIDVVATANNSGCTGVYVRSVHAEKHHLPVS